MYKLVSASFSTSRSPGRYNRCQLNFELRAVYNYCAQFKLNLYELALGINEALPRVWADIIEHAQNRPKCSHLARKARQQTN